MTFNEKIQNFIKEYKDSKIDDVRFLIYEIFNLYLLKVNFEDKSNNLTKKLKNLITSTSKKEATSILLNDSNIANVKIKFSPFWLIRVKQKCCKRCCFNPLPSGERQEKRTK